MLYTTGYNVVFIVYLAYVLLTAQTYSDISNSHVILRISLLSLGCVGLVIKMILAQPDPNSWDQIITRARQELRSLGGLEE